MKAPRSGPGLLRCRTLVRDLFLPRPLGHCFERAMLDRLLTSRAGPDALRNCIHHGFLVQEGEFVRLNRSAEIELGLRPWDLE